jgi:hypothetical protein
MMDEQIINFFGYLTRGFTPCKIYKFFKGIEELKIKELKYQGLRYQRVKILKS